MYRNMYPFNTLNWILIIGNTQFLFLYKPKEIRRFLSLAFLSLSFHRTSKKIQRYIWLTGTDDFSSKVSKKLQFWKDIRPFLFLSFLLFFQYFRESARKAKCKFVFWRDCTLFFYIFNFSICKNVKHWQEIIFKKHSIDALEGHFSSEQVLFR